MDPSPSFLLKKSLNADKHLLVITAYIFYKEKGGLTMIQYRVKKCDSLWKIARNYNVSLESVIAANPQIADPNFILPGTIINVPELWQPKPGYPYNREQNHMNNNMTNGNNQNSYPNNEMNNQDNYMPQEKYNNKTNSNHMQKDNYTYDSPPLNGYNNSIKNSPRPFIYEANAAETLEQISHKFMIPLTRLLYYNLKYCKNEPLAQGSRIIIPEYNMVYPNMANPDQKYYNNK
jgi:spore coat assembly protein SafA